MKAHIIPCNTLLPLAHTLQAQVYSIEDSALCLTGTAEVPLAGLYMDRVLQESELPIRMAAFGHCFRTGEIIGLCG